MPPLRPTCVKCQREYKVEEGGVLLVEYFVTREGTVPYALWYADLWVCPDCGHQIVGGYGEGPAAHWHEEEKMQRIIDAYKKANRRIFCNVPHNALKVVAE